MATFRCPKHDVLFEANKPPTQDGHKKCPQCSPKPKGEAGKPAAPVASTIDGAGHETE